MRWDREYDSSDVEDRRGSPAMQGGGAGFLLPLFFRFGWKGALLAAILYFGARAFMGGHAANQPGEQPGHDQARAFVGFVLDDVQKTWRGQLGDRYQPAHVVLYTGATRTGCGFGQAAVGPFYCPSDEKVYLDVGFFRELHDRFGAGGDFAQAYVIAHEMGHHMQRQLGITERVDQAPRNLQTGAGKLSVRTELQADCFAGVWARSAQARNILEPGDIDEAMRAAAAVGDDRLQQESSGAVQPEKWTHGSAAERTHWFHRGYETGRLDACDTFAAGSVDR